MTAARLLLALTLAGCAATAPDAPGALEGTSAPQAAQPAVEQPTAEQQRLEDLYWQRVAQSRADYTEADVHFMTGMIGHHAQALVMSAMAEPNGASAELRTLAARIANAQRDEIATMQRWLRDRDRPVPDPRIAGTVLTVGVEGDPDAVLEHTHHTMPGMLSQAQLDEMHAARGNDFDRLFLQYMIRHHAGAVVMVDELLAVDGAAEDQTAFRLASDIRADQTTEIERMRAMLDARGGPIYPEAAPVRSRGGHH